LILSGHVVSVADSFKNELDYAVHDPVK